MQKRDLRVYEDHFYGTQHTCQFDEFDQTHIGLGESQQNGITLTAKQLPKQCAEQHEPKYERIVGDHVNRHRCHACGDTQILVQAIHTYFGHIQ